MDAERLSIGALARAGPPLPNVADYFRAILDLGRRSFRPALPALAFLYFYRLGVGAYAALSDSSYSESSFSGIGSFAPQLAIVGSILPVLLLIYTPFLPLQDALLRERAASFLGAVRQVLEVTWSFMLSGIVQLAILVIPFVALGIVAGIVLPDSTSEDGPGRLAAVGVVLLVGGFWFLVASFFLMFATPAVVLDRAGPIRAVVTSLRLVRRHFGGLLGRLFAFGFFALFVYFVAIIPTAILTAVEQTSGVPSAPLKVAGVIWTSAVDTLFFPFWVAALILLYRALVPAAGAVPAGAATIPGEDEIRAAAARIPFE